MDRWASIGLVLLTTAAGACAAFGVATYLIRALEISNREGASGYFAVFVIGIGLIGGFIVGLITALASHSGFWISQGYALGAVAILAGAGAVLPAVLNDEGPKLRGEKLVAEVEVKLPPGWSPDNRAKFEAGGFCWIQYRAEDGTLEENPIVSGGFTLQPDPETEGRWLTRCAVDLTKTTRGRYLRVFVGNRTDLTIPLPFPRSPRPADEAWTPWSTSGFLPQKDKPVQPGSAYRCRVQIESEYKRDHPDPEAAFQEARRAAIAAVPPDAPLVKWLPFFEGRDGKGPPFNSGLPPELQFVKTRAAELAPLLRSENPTVVRQAVYAAATLDALPASLVDPLAAAGRHIQELIRMAHERALPDDPDLSSERAAYELFFWWNQAMEHTGSAGAKARRAALEELAPLVRDSRKFSDLEIISEQIQKVLQEQ